MSRADSWMPLYVGDYLADTMHLTTVQHGAYLLLLMHYWRSGPMINDVYLLTSVSRISAKMWHSNVRDAVLPFFELRDGYLHQKRMDRERTKAADISQKRREAAYASHASGPGYPGGTNGVGGANAPANAPANALQMQSKCRAKAPRLHVQSRADIRAGHLQSQKKDTTPGGVDTLRASCNDFWRVGSAVIGGLTGMPERGARSLLGRLLSQAGDDQPRVLAALRQAERDSPVDPVAWLIRATQQRPRPGFRNGFLQVIDDEGMPSQAGGDDPVTAFLGRAANGAD